ncbi:nacht domain-containing protein [Fusarium flagelliforme]|uniref:Nacht domain-containing protein n=1 Tax=Fusarium flagelliforme TaxID=2675880 RepID=A0A395N3Q8_9HYPO|nr:nacht domain-containing protein [Fusarium flagelliforme]
MAQRIMKVACDRFRSEISPEDTRIIEATTKLDDVKLAIGQVESQLAARQLLRDMDRISPFIDAIERYSKALEVAANGTPYLPWLWAPIKLILLAVQDHTHALDKILSAYGQIGLQMPRFSRFAEVFPDERSFQHLLGWKMLFKSAWGGFEHRFGSLLESIARVSVEIDREAMAIDIIQAVDQRKRDADAAAERESQWRTQQLCIVLNWLEASDTDQQTKFEILRDRCHEGTLGWVTSSPKLRAWLRTGGKQVLWLHGKPGSGKSVLAAKLISFLSADTTRKVVFFFCDFNTPVHAASTRIFRALTSQILRLSPDTAPFVYEDYIARGKKPTNDTLTKLLPQLIANINDLRIVVDGLDEISTSEHRKLITDLLRVTKDAPGCNLLLISQDVSSISIRLSKQPRLSMAEEGANIEKDFATVVKESLKDLDSQHDGALGEMMLDSLGSKILQKAEGTSPNSFYIALKLIRFLGMFLWVHLVLDILVNAACLEDLFFQINSLPTTLAEAFLEGYKNPFITKLQSHASIAYACVCQLIQGLDLLAPSSASLCPVEIASGLLSLWPYSLEHWIEHLLDCFEVEQEVMPECLRPLLQRVDMLCHQLLSSESRKLRANNFVADVDKDQRFINLMKSINPSVSELIRELRNVSSWANDDQSPLAQPMRTYQSITEFLMRKSSVDGISTATLLAFKEQQGAGAFLCDIRGCQHAVIGFPSKEKRENHRQLHFQDLKCYAVNCTYSDVGFKTERSLKAHRKRYHEAAESDQLQKRLRRVANALPEVSHQDLLDENDWDYLINPAVPRQLTVTPHHFIPVSDLVYCMSFSLDGKRIAVGTYKAALIFDVRTGTLLQKLSHSGDGELDDIHVLSVCFSPDVPCLATGSQDGLIRIWDLRSGGEIKVLRGHKGEVAAVSFAPQGGILVSVGADDRAVVLWNTQYWDFITLLQLPDAASSLSISPDSKYLAVGCFDNNCYVFHVEDKALYTVLRGHKHAVASVAFSPDNKHISTTSHDRTIKIWSLGYSPKLTMTLEGHEVGRKGCGL